MLGYVFKVTILGAFLASAVAQSTGSNVNISLNLGDQNAVSLLPQGTWQTSPTSSSCSGTTQDGSTDYFTTTTESFLSTQFRGIAAYVFGIRTTSSGLVNFKVDDKPLTSLTLLSQSTICDSLLYSITDLSDGPHNLTITFVQSSASGNGSTIGRVDVTSIVYTQTPSSNSTSTTSGGSSSSSNTGAIVGGVVGGVVAAAIVLFVIYYMRNRRKHRRSALPVTRGVRGDDHDLDVDDLPDIKLQPAGPQQSVDRIPSGITPFVTDHHPAPSTAQTSSYGSPYRSPSSAYPRDVKRRPATPDSTTFSGAGETEGDVMSYNPLQSQDPRSVSTTQVTDYSVGHVRSLSDDSSYLGPRSATSGSSAAHANLVREVAREIAAALIPQAGGSHQAEAHMSEPPPVYVEYDQAGPSHVTSSPTEASPVRSLPVPGQTEQGRFVVSDSDDIQEIPRKN